MKDIIAKHKKNWSDISLITPILTGLLFFVGSLFVSSFATIYATERAGSNVPDLIISNIPVVNVDFVVSELALFFFIFIVIVTLLHPKKVPFILKSAALFILIRAMFVTLTHLGPFPQRSFIDQSEFFGPLNIGSDFFFSGHTGLPFLLALMFWEENKLISGISLVASVIFGVSVLLGHLHYSIDVFAAFFITYTIYDIAQKLFKKDLLLFRKKPANTY
jgi:membrane-associated phospholipid phosphatase